MPLILTRREEQKIVLEVEGRTVLITVTKISRSRVSIGITAPDEVKVRRGELEPREAA